MDKQTKQLRSDGKTLEPILQVGKSGLTPGVIDEIDRELDQRGLIKIKILPSALPAEGHRAARDAIAKEIVERTHAKLVERVGNIVVLYRP